MDGFALAQIGISTQLGSATEIHPQWHYISSILMGDANQKQHTMDTQTTLKESVLAEASRMLHSSVSSIRSEAANIPDGVYLNPNKSLQHNAQVLAQEIRDMRQAEVDFFKSHPELNP